MRRNILVKGLGYKKQYAYICIICNEQALSRQIKHVPIRETIYDEEAQDAEVHRKVCFDKFKEQYEWIEWIEGAKVGLVKNKYLWSWVRKPAIKV